MEPSAAGCRAFRRRGIRLLGGQRFERLVHRVEWNSRKPPSVGSDDVGVRAKVLSVRSGLVLENAGMICRVFAFSCVPIALSSRYRWAPILVATAIVWFGCAFSEFEDSAATVDGSYIFREAGGDGFWALGVCVVALAAVLFSGSVRRARSR